MNLALTKNQRLDRLAVLAKAQNWSKEKIQQATADIEAMYAAAPAPSPAIKTHISSGKPASKKREPDLRFAIAPYRFVPLNNKVVGSPLNSATFNQSVPTDGNLCASLSVTVVAETPMLIGRHIDPENKYTSHIVPLSLTDNKIGPWWVPGASLRGMLRASAEAIGFARLEQTNKHYVFPLRDFEHPHYNYKPEDGEVAAFPTLGDAKRVKIGWLRQEKVDGQQQWAIYASRLGYVSIADLLSKFSVRLDEGKTWNDLELVKKYEAIRHARSTGKDRVPDYAKSVSFSEVGKLTSGHPELAVGGGNNWVPVFSSKSPSGNEGFEKKWEYAILPFDTSQQRFKVSEREWLRFTLVHTKPGRQDREPDGSWRVLEPMARLGGEGHPQHPVPVFYVGEPGQENFAFGLTRLFKIPHRLSIGDMLEREAAHRIPKGNYEPDLVSMLFGWVHEPDGNADIGEDAGEASQRKGRIAVSGARISSDVARIADDNGQPFETVMGAPRASFAPFYLVGTQKDWSDVTTDTGLAGRKRYLPRVPGQEANKGMDAYIDKVRERFQSQLDQLERHARNKPDNKSRLKLLAAQKGKDLSFTFRIELHNVHPVELGLVLWLLTFGNGPEISTHRHMLGRGKAFGLGQLRIEKLDVDDLTVLGSDPKIAENSKKVPDFINEFESYMDAKLGSPFRQQPQVRDFLAYCNPAVGARLPDANWQNKKERTSGTAIYLQLRDHKAVRGSAAYPMQGRKRFLLPPS